MSRSINGRYTLAYPNLLGFQELTSDSITDKTTGHTVFYDITDLETHSSLSDNITIGTTNANTITINSGSTTYNNNEIIKLKDNTVGALKYQCNDGGLVDVVSINTTVGNKTLTIGGNIITSGSVNCSTANATNIYASGSINATSISDTGSTTTGAIITAGGVGIAKSLNVGQNIGCNNLTCGSACNVGSLVSGGAISGTTITGTGNLTVGANNMTCGNLICSNTVSCWGVSSSGAISGTTITGTGALNVGTNTITSGTINSSGAINCGTLTATNLYLPTTGGTATALNYYEEATITIALAPSIGGAYVYNGNAYLIRIGKFVTLRIPVFTGNALGGYMIAAASSGIPVRFRPASNAVFAIPVMMSNGTNGVNQYYPGQLVIASTGEIKIYSTFGGAGIFTSGAGSGLLGDLVVSWTMN